MHSSNFCDLAREQQWLWNSRTQCDKLCKAWQSNVSMQMWYNCRGLHITLAILLQSCIHVVCHTVSDSCTTLVKLYQLYSGLKRGSQRVFTTKSFATCSTVFIRYVFSVVQHIIYVTVQLLADWTANWIINTNFLIWRVIKHPKCLTDSFYS